mgnify:CR=1 FL=1
MGTYPAALKGTVGGTYMARAQADKGSWGWAASHGANAPTTVQKEVVVRERDYHTSTERIQ